MVSSNAMSIGYEYVGKPIIKFPKRNKIYKIAYKSNSETITLMHL